MKAEQIIDQLQQQGILLTAQQDALQVTAAPGAVTAEIATLIRSHKTALLSYLAEQSVAASPAQIGRAHV